MFNKLVLLSPRGSYTWSEAYDNCKASKGYIASEIGYNSTVDSPKSSSAWVGKVELASKWLQIMGCYVFNTTRGNIFQVPTIAFCEMQCSSFRYFAFRAQIEPVCLCMSQLPTKNSNAYSCESIRTYKFLIVYSRYLRSKSYENEIGNCMYSSCTTSPMQIDGPYVSNCTSSSVRGVCALGDRVEDKNIGWTNSLNECIAHYGTYFPDDFRQVCSYVGSPSWTNIFRQNRSFFYTIPSNNDELSHRIPLKCASINIDSPYGPRMVNDKVLFTRYVACNTRLPYFLCETGSIIGGVVSGLIVLVVISIVLVIYKKRSVSICRLKSDVSVTEELSNNASASDECGLDNNDDNENQTNRIDYFSSQNRVNSSHLLPCENVHTEKIQSGGNDENNTCENGSDHELVDEAGKQSGKQNHYETSSRVNTALSRTQEGGSDSLHYAQDRKMSTESIDVSSDFLEVPIS
ncbi:unnamed protein product [Mytilus coruscus]|uniref:Uncharacterized protein n=1 Tax=Mytilus coruscus TaxID=42192 RepID=A0A6J8ENL0_MYTCO|nr:unnamed protein product [Mytilus coruscus]